MASDSITVSTRYEALVSAGKVERDGRQQALARRLDTLLAEIGSQRVARKSSALGWLFAKAKPPEAIKGFYIHGPVGRGKTMLMDIFFSLVSARRKRRAHFNDFMADVHARIHAHRQKLKRGETSEKDPIPPVADALFEEAWILCFDEFSVTDITDAMLLSRLFEALFERGCVLVATSNVAPDDLYSDGLNRDLFLPFVDLLKNHTRIFELDARTDYRLETTAGHPVYRWPLDGEARSAMDQAWNSVAAGKAVEEDTLTVNGHTVPVPRRAGQAARFSFADLCARPLGASDYIALAERFDTIFVDDVGRLSPANRNEAKRFITLIDTLYDHHVRIFVSAEARAQDLMEQPSGNEGFEFERTVSRLVEMQSDGYLAASKAARSA